MKRLLILILLISSKNLISQLTPEINVMKKENLIEQLIISNLNNSYSIGVANLIPLGLGADANALTYKVQTLEQKTYFVKLKRGQTNGTLYIIDWDQPIMAPKERDLMFIGAGVGNVWNTKHEEDLFYAGYGKTEINKTIIDYYRCVRILEDVVEYNQELLSTGLGYKNRLTSYKHFIAMFGPNGVVDIALRS